MSRRLTKQLRRDPGRRYPGRKLNVNVDIFLTYVPGISLSLSFYVINYAHLVEKSTPMILSSPHTQKRHSRCNLKEKELLSEETIEEEQTYTHISRYRA